MAIEDTKRIKATNSETTANQLLDLGWTLLLVQPMQDGNDQYTRYHFGWQKAGEPAPTGAEPGITLGRHVTG